MIFSQIERNDLSGSGHSEPLFMYLNRSARSSAKRVRALIEKWFTQYPETERADLLPRLRSIDNEVFISGFFELLLYALLLKMGYEIEIHPEINHDILKRPDFFAKNENEEFYIEAVLAHEFSPEERKGQDHLNIALDKVNEIMSTDFFADVSTRGIASKPIKSNNLKKDISDWFLTLNYDELFKVYQTNGLQGMPFRVYEYEGISIRVKPIPKNLLKGKLGKLIGSQMYGVRLVNTKKAIRKVIKRKSSRYGVVNKPYLLAINLMSMSCEYEDVFDALFGTEQFTIDLDKLGTENPTPSRLNDGMWTKKIGTRLSGVFVCRFMSPWTIYHQNSTLFLNPWAQLPYEGNLLQFHHAKTTDMKTYKLYPGMELKDILELPINWPENEE